MLNGKKILLAVSGSIAAYKSAFFVRLLIKSGAEVRVVMTESATDFITPLTLATLSKHKVYRDFFNKETGEWDSHVELGLWADVMVVAPASANTLSKMANGNCDNLLIATYLSARCPVFFAPAMDLDMHLHPSTQANIRKLESYGNHQFAAEDGELASGLSGVGRMAEPKHMIEQLEKFFQATEKLTGKKVLITSGPTHEQIDAVRFIGNNSSGKMGYELAMNCLVQGAQVTFITGPTQHIPTGENLQVIKINSAQEMYEATDSNFGSADVAIFAAAVSDYRPKSAVDHKMKKTGNGMSIELVENKDIAAEMGERKTSGQITVGFALETNEEGTNAQKKLEQKNFDFIALNSLNDEGAGFSHATNKVTIYSRDNNPKAFELKTKKEVASDIVNEIVEKLNA
ncbi:MAG: bifunctional phosphopantothenoylcysteine decarboxylase/phosphopantothenate--cysteine ligase CoaBC [Cytophagales bacterium]|nr:bifunctional phosphopantothenoylcysteine decarboxylase/phosphopantothenate--cysteine ligase CoaBC [Cytophagales bacterium]